MENIALQINDAFLAEYGDYAEVGSAYVTGSFSDCCPVELHVNTCDTNFELRTTGGTAITPCTNVNPFTEYGSFTNVQDCIDCGDAPTTRAYTVGIRVISERFKESCGAILNKPLSTYLRTIDIVPWADYFDGSWDKVNVVSPEMPGQFGSQIQWYEYQQEIGGEGRNAKRTSNLRGWIASPAPDSRHEKMITASCKDHYCSYFMKYRVDRKAPMDATGQRGLDLHGYLHVPAEDSITKASVEEFLTALAALSPDAKVGSISCDTSQVVAGLELT